MMVSMRPRSHEIAKIHEQGTEMQFKFQVFGIEDFDAKCGK
jgi:hypothetical protein